MTNTKRINRVHFSSSSDDELEQELQQQSRRTLQAQKGIIRVNQDNEEDVAIVYNGQTVRPRKGTILLPVCERYVHILDAKSHPERFFGDPSLHPRRRKPLPSGAVELLEVNNRGNMGSRSITLANARPNRFYVFKGLKKVNAEIEKGPIVAEQTSERILAEPNYQRIINYERWRRSYLHPSRFHVCEVEQLHTNEKLSDVMSADSQDRVWWYDIDAFSFGSLEYKDRIHDFVRQTYYPKLPSQKAIGVRHVQLTHAVNAGFEGILLVGEKYFAFASLQSEYLDTAPRIPSHFHIASETQIPIFEKCYCSAKATPSPWLALSTGGMVMEARLNLHIGRWEMRKIGDFSARHPITSLCAIHEGYDEPRIILCGLRNGTIQALPLQGSLPSYDNTCRHHHAQISFLYPLLHTEHQFVSVASNAETKLWDWRYYSSNRHVSTLHPGTRFGIHEDLNTSVSNGLIAISSPILGLSCSDINTRSTLFESFGNVPRSSNILIHTVGIDYELIVFTPNYTQRYFLRNDT